MFWPLKSILGYLAYFEYFTLVFTYVQNCGQVRKGPVKLCSPPPPLPKYICDAVNFKRQYFQDTQQLGGLLMTVYFATSHTVLLHSTI